MRRRRWVGAFLGVVVLGGLGLYWANGGKMLRGAVEKIGPGAELLLLYDDPWELNEGNAAELHFIDLDNPRDSVEKRAVKTEFKLEHRLPLMGLQLGHRYRLNGVFYLCRHTQKGVCTRNPREALIEVVEGGNTTLEIAVEPKG